jgi:hypothetical protein
MLGPTRDDPLLDNPVVDYAIAHPPQHGRILGYAGMGSYILYRSARTPVVVDGWLEHFTPADIRANYGVLNGTARDLKGAADRLQVGAVVARRPEAISRLEANGYVPEFSSVDGTYLVRRDPQPRRSGARLTRLR